MYPIAFLASSHLLEVIKNIGLSNLITKSIMIIVLTLKIAGTAMKYRQASDSARI